MVKPNCTNQDFTCSECNKVVLETNPLPHRLGDLKSKLTSELAKILNGFFLH